MTSLLDQLRTIPSSHHATRDWFAKLPPGVQQEIREAARAKASGELPHSYLQIATLVRSRFSLESSAKYIAGKLKTLGTECHADKPSRKR